MTFASGLNPSSILYCALDIRLLITASRGLLVPAKSGPSNGSLPHSIANKITPSAQTSSGGPIKKLIINNKKK